jgi:DNA-directed RNA polymerase specialized sigma24 family protein
VLSGVVRGRTRAARRSDARAGSSRTAARGDRNPRIALSPRERELIRGVLARRGARERLVVTLLLYERLRPSEVAGVLGLSLAQVGRTYAALLLELRRALQRRRVTRPATLRRAA